MDTIYTRLWHLLAYDPANPMLFNTGLFLVLFVAFFLIYQCFNSRSKLRMLFVMAFSLYFYYKSSGWCVAILCGVCLSDYWLGRLLGAVCVEWQRRAVVAANVAVNVGMLVYFKYFNLLADAFCSIVGTTFDPLDIILPAGISFFTFRSISYMVDIYRGEIAPCRSFLDYAFFLTFFPPLLAGPVVRAKDLLPQIAERPSASPQMIAQGLFLVMTGLVKKVVIADYISGNFVDRIFDNPTLYSGFENLMGCVGFTVQLYCDFSGYSDMAIGLALMLGFRFADNFAAPFKSQSPSEFWHRWHISLSTWLRDYVYIPLGGNRRGRVRAYINQFITMVVGGLWHGASWMYLIWGAYHGLLLAVHKAIKRVWTVPEHLKGTLVVRATNVVITFVLVVIGFAIFRAPSMVAVEQIYTQIFTAFHIEVLPQFVSGYSMIVLAIMAGYLAHMSPRSWTLRAQEAYVQLNVVGQAFILVAVLFFVIQTRQSELVPFIYLQY